MHELQLEPDDHCSDFVRAVCLYIFRNHMALSGTIVDLILCENDVNSRAELGISTDRGIGIDGMMFETDCIVFESEDDETKELVLAVRLCPGQGGLIHVGKAAVSNKKHVSMLVERTARLLIGHSL